MSDADASLAGSELGQQIGGCCGRKKQKQAPWRAAERAKALAEAEALTNADDATVDGFEAEAKEAFFRARQKLVESGMLVVKEERVKAMIKARAAAGAAGAKAPDVESKPDAALLDPMYVPRFDLTTNTGSFCSRRGEKLNLYRVFCTRTSTEASSSKDAQEYEYPPGYLASLLEQAKDAEDAKGAACCDAKCTRIGGRPCPGGWRVSSLAEMGAGVTAHFKFLKAVATLFAIMLCFYIPQIALNRDAESADAQLSGLASTTVGNLFPINGSLLVFNEGKTIIDAAELARAYAGLDIICVILFMATYFWITEFLNREQKSVDKFSLTMQDYTVMVPNLPVGTTEDDLKAWVARTVLSVPKERLDLYNMVDDINAGYRAGDATKAPLISLGNKADPDNYARLAAVVFKLAQITLIPDHHVLLPLLQRMGVLRKRLEELRGAIQARAIRRKALRGKCCASFRADILATAPSFQCALPATLCCCVKVAPENRDLLVKAFVAAKEQFIAVCDDTDRAVLRIAEQHRKCVAGVPEAAPPCGLTNPLACILPSQRVPADPLRPVAAFVTFEHCDAKDRFLKFFPDDALSWFLQPCVCPHRRLVVGGGSPAAAAAGASPLQTRRAHAYRTRAVEAPMPSALIPTNLHIGPLAKRLRTLFSNVGALLFIGISFGVIFACSSQTSSLQSQLKPVDCSDRKLTAFTRAFNRAQDKWFTTNPSFAAQKGSYLTPDETTFLPNLPADNKLLYCVCESRKYPTKLDKNDVRSDKYHEYCPYHVCPVLKALGDKSYQDDSRCVELDLLARKTSLFSLAASVVVAVVNVTLGLVIRKLSNFEGHSSTEKANISVAFRLFLAQFFNTAVLVVLVNAAWGSVGRYSDLTPGWYSAVGSGLLSTMFLQVIVPHIGIILGIRGACAKWRNKALYSSNTSESTMKTTLLGPNFDSGLRLAQITNHIYVTYTFAAGMPLMIFAGMLGGISSFFVDKIALLRLYRRPPFDSKALLNSMTSLLPIAVIIHVCLGAWILGTVFELNDGNAPGTTEAPARRLATVASQDALDADLVSAVASPRIDFITTVGLHGFGALSAAAAAVTSYFASAPTAAAAAAPTEARAARFAAALASVPQPAASVAVPAFAIARSLSAVTSDYGCTCVSPCDAVTAAEVGASTEKACKVSYGDCPFASIYGWDADANTYKAYDTCGDNSEDTTCFTQWWLPQCAASPVGGEMQKLLLGDVESPTTAAALAQLSFLGDTTLVRAIAGKTPAASSSSTLESDSGTIFGRIQLDRVFSTGGVPLFGMFIVTVVLYFLFNVIRTLIRAIGNLREYLNPAGGRKDGDSAGEAGMRTVPFSRAVRGERGLQDYRRLTLVGRTYALEAQESILQSSGLDAVLLEADPRLKAAHLLFASSDGILDPAVGLAFMTPFFWHGKEARQAFLERQKQDGHVDFKVPEHLITLDAEGYVDRVAKWFAAASEIGPLDSRMFDNRPWQEANFKEGYAARQAAELAAAGAALQLRAPAAAS